jgi:hypothetical protein
MTYEVVKMGDNTYQTSVVASQLVVMSHRSSYIPSSRLAMVDTRPKAEIRRAEMPFRLQTFAMRVIYSPDFGMIDSQVWDTKPWASRMM